MTIIRVTQEHINKGKPGADQCPIYHAAIDAGLAVESVDAELIWYSNDIRYVWGFPEHILNKIRDYDEGKPMYPFEFTINEPLEALIA